MTTQAPETRQITLDDYERTFPNMDYEVSQWPEGDFRRISKPKIKFYVPNRQCAWRVETLDTKEPDTIAWLAQMKPGEVLYDVGANMGQYSMIAVQRGLTVHAFEPEAQNFSLLCKNIAINRMFDRCTAWPLCLTDGEFPMLDTFYSQGHTAGGSCSSFGDAVNFHLQPKKYPVKQGSVGFPMHRVATVVGCPDHVKIDVDGLEHRVVAGMGDLLNTVKSVLVEINTALPEHLQIIETMGKHNLLPDLETAEQARRTEGAFAGIGNMIFYRRGYVYDHG